MTAILPRIFVLLIGLSTGSSGQVREIRFTRLTVEQGLPTSSVYSVFQDSRGFMWFGTTGGLCRYDGFTFKVYDNTPIYAGSMFLEDKRGSLWFMPAGGELRRLDLFSEKVTRYHIGLGHRAYVISKDAAGNVWVGTMGDGLAKYVSSADSFLVYRHHRANNASLSSDSVYAIFGDAQGNLWIGTRRGLDKFIGGKEMFVHCGQVGVEPVRWIVEDKERALWLGTYDGLCRFDVATGDLERYRNNDPGQNRIYSVYVTSRDGLWVAAGDRIERFDRLTKTFIAVRGASSDEPMGTGSGTDSYFLEDRQQRLWVVTSAGLALYDRRGGKLDVFGSNPREPRAMPEGYVTAITEDAAGNLWFATQTGGVCFLDHVNLPFLHIAQNPSDRIHLSHASVSAVLEDRSGFIWVGSHHGLDRLNLSTGTRTHFDEDPTNPDSLMNGRILELLEDSSGIIWIGTSGGLCMLNKVTRKFSYFRQHAERAGFSASQEICAICIDTEGAMWLGGGIGSGLLERFDRKKRIFTDYYSCGHPGYSGLHANPIGPMLEDRNRNLWLSALGLGVFDRKTGQAHYYRHDPEDSSSLGSDNVPSICEDRSGVLWVGLATGLDRFDNKTGKFRHITVKDGLASGVVYDLLEDNSGSARGKGAPGNLWLATAMGISRFDPVSKSVRNYGPAEGVPIAPSEFVHSCFKNRDGYLYFGGTNGFVKFHPDSVRDNDFVPPIVITSFKKFNVEARLDSAITIKKAIELSYAEDVISFEFAALNYTRPEKNQFAYRMDGFDKAWVICGTRHSAMYTSLHPGTYVFRVKGSNNDGVWNETGTSVTLIITPSWWQTRWAYFGYAVLIFGSMYVTWRMQLRRIRMRHEFQMSRFEAEKLHEVDEMKSRFFTNISHEFRTPLTLILGPVKQISERTGDEKTREELGMVHRNANKLLRLVNQLLDIAKLESGSMRLQATPLNVVPLIKALTLSFASHAERKKITLTFGAAGDDITAYIDGEKFERIITNVLSNAFKFTPEGGKIEVNVRASETCVEIVVSDTGIGIPKEKIPKIFDRFYQVNGTHTREQEGTGLGLALTKELIELHRGKIAVESEEGRGTTFTISFPLGKEHLKPEELCEKSGSEDGLSDSIFDPILFADTGREKCHVDLVSASGEPVVLIVEDNSDVRHYIKDNLEKDCSVIEAVDGEDGWDKSLEHMPDVIVSDVMMPKINGFGLCAKLKTDERTSHIPVILLTAKSTTQDKIEGFETGADDYLMKPFEPEELRARIKNLIVQRERLHEHFRKKGIIELDNLKVTPVDEKFLKKVIGIITENIPNPSFSVESLAEMSAVSRSVLHRKIVSLTGEPPVELIRRMRLTRAAELIEKKAGNMSQIALEAGFTNPAYFSECFRKQFGVSPSHYSTISRHE